ncbi:MAG: hypothetical protein CR997_07270 [Acidobacteria bacterium]|nr:MAG: hypothetical protein CR997_07270 [Acidobacteriota bacterium]
MEPEWKQDIKSIDYPNNPLPQYELMGFQEDIVADQKVMRKIILAISLCTAIAALAAVLFYLKDAKTFHREMLHKRSVNSKENPFKSKISLKVLQTRKTKSIQGLIGSTRVKSGFTFFIARVRILNEADRNFQVNPYGLALLTESGKRYNPHVGQRKLKEGIRSKVLKPGMEVEGEYVFELPIHEKVSSLVIKSYSGTLAKHHF